MNWKNSSWIGFLLLIQTGCDAQTIQTSNETKTTGGNLESNNVVFIDSTFKTIHVFVALCDNKYQGIVPVPAKIGNGQDPDNNLYWGCAFGIKTFFSKSAEWKKVKIQKIDSVLLERIIFKHVSKNWYLIADAYNGKNIEKCTVDFMESSAGLRKDTLHLKNQIIGTYGNASLLTYIGHDGLMDFQLSESFVNKDSIQRNCIALACYSKSYFAPHLKNAHIIPLVWTTGLMCPEAYTLHDAISAFLSNKSDEEIRNAAALAYSKYQKCSLKAAKGLLVKGW